MKAWEDLLSSLEQVLGKDAIAKWLRPIKILRFDAANLYLDATPFQKAWFEEHVRGRVPFFNNNQRPIRIHFPPFAEKKAPPQNLQFASDPLESELRLEGFLPTQKNTLAHQMALELSTGANLGFNPVYYYGTSGSGKTHLLTSIAHVLKERGRHAFYLSAETFTGHVVNAIRLGKMQEFREKVREIDTLLVDDIHLFARRNATQEEFFHTFNRLHTAGKQIILSGNVRCAELPEIEPRLISRFEWGISLKLEAPDRELSLCILEKKAALLDHHLTPEMAAFLLERFISHPKAPIIALHTLCVRTHSCQNPKQAEILLADLLEKERKTHLTPEKIIKHTAAHFGIRIEDLIGKSQLREFVKPRQIAMYFCRSLLDMPFQKIGLLFGRDHSTVMASIALVEKGQDTPLSSESLKELAKSFTGLATRH
jgi:chromosomal replication initiator protein